MDIEQRFISALLHASRAEQNKYFARQIPPSIFRQREPEIRFIYAHREKHGRFPTPTLVSTRFHWKVKVVKETINESVEAVIGQEHYRQIKNVVEKVRELIDQGQDMTKVVNFFRHEAQELRLFDTSAQTVKFNMSKGALLRYAELQKELKTPKGNLFQSPWPKLNKIAKFFRPSDLLLIVGRLGMGKSWLIVYWAWFLAKQGSRVMLVSKEMSTEAMEDRLEALNFHLDWEHMRAGSLPKNEIKRWTRARMKRSIPEIIINGHETMKGTGFAEIVSEVEKEKPQAVFIDAAYRIATEELPRNANEVAKLTYIAQTGKRLAKSYNILVGMSTQMNRQAEDKLGNTKGGVTTVYGADAWMQEADAAFEVSGNRKVDNQRMLSILKGREFKGFGDILLNFQLSPYPDFSECTTSQIAQANPVKKFNGL